MDGAQVALPPVGDGFRADLTCEEIRFVSQPGLTAPESQGGFRLLTPNALVASTPQDEPPPEDPQPPSQAARPDRSEQTEPLTPVEHPVMPRQPMPSAALLAETRAAALAEGRALGLAEADVSLRSQKDLLFAQAQTLAVALAQLNEPPVDDVDALARALAVAVARLASERAGQAIDAFPEPFARRITRLAERVAQGTRDTAIHLHPDDLQAVRPLLSGACPPELAALALARLVPDERIARGDADLRAPGLRLADLSCGTDNASLLARVAS